MINLITGLPGHGKSLYTLWHVKKRIDQENKDLIAAGKEVRTVYYHGIPELTLDWVQFDKPDDWHKLPSGSIVVMDEAQKCFRPRGSAAAVPEHVQKLETHRHQGLDLYIITQHPMLIDGNVRRLVDRHYHVFRPFGWSKSTVLDFQGCKTEPMQKSHRADAQKSKFIFPKELFGCYKSAEMHTAKSRLPGKFLFLLAAPFLLVFMGWFAWHKLQLSSGQKPQQVTNQGIKPDALQGRPVDAKKTQAEWVADYQPRVAGLVYTAPRYDDVTKPVTAPSPDACISGAKGCKCYSQQGTQLDVPQDLCKSIVDRGFYKDWGDPVSKQNLPVIASASVPATRVASSETSTGPAPYVGYINSKPYWNSP